MPVYEARPASGGPYPIVLVISEVWGVHEYIRDCTRRFAKAGYYAVAPELFKREGGVAQLPNIQDILKIVFAVPRKQVLGDSAGHGGLGEDPSRHGREQDRRDGLVLGRRRRPFRPRRRSPTSRRRWPGMARRPVPFPTSPIPSMASTWPRTSRCPFLGSLRREGPEPQARGRGEVRQRWSRRPGTERRDHCLSGVGHGFHADYRPSYDAAAAADGWKRCTDHFAKHLKA